MKIHVLELGPLGTCCYIATDEATNLCAVIDPADSCEVILDQTEKKGYKIDKILLTHMHFDHIGPLNRLADVTGAEIFIGSGDADGLSSPFLNLSQAFGQPFTCDHKVCRVNEGDSIYIGKTKLSVLHTPGHTPGSVCYEYADGKVIFSGDTVFYQSIGRTDFPGGSYKQIMASLERILSFNEEYVLYPGPGPKTTVGDEKKYNPYYER